MLRECIESLSLSLSLCWCGVVGCWNKLVGDFREWLVGCGALIQVWDVGFIQTSIT